MYFYCRPARFLLLHLSRTASVCISLEQYIIMPADSFPICIFYCLISIHQTIFEWSIQGSYGIQICRAESPWRYTGQVNRRSTPGYLMLTCRNKGITAKYLKKNDYTTIPYPLWAMVQYGESIEYSDYGESIMESIVICIF